MADFGDKLRKARQRRGISLRQIADRTKISVAALESLEQNDPSRLPGGIFSRALVRSYASEVGLDPDATLREFISRFDIEPPVDRVHMADVADFDRTFERHERVGRLVLKIIVASLVAVAIVLYLMRARHPDDQSTTSPPDSGRRTSRRIGARSSAIIPPRA